MRRGRRAPSARHGINVLSRWAKVSGSISSSSHLTKKEAFSAIDALSELFCGQIVGGDPILHFARIGPIEVDGQSDECWRMRKFVGQRPYAPFILAQHPFEGPDDLPDIGTAYECRPPPRGSIPVNDAGKRRVFKPSSRMVATKVVADAPVEAASS